MCIVVMYLYVCRWMFCIFNICGKYIIVEVGFNIKVIIYGVEDNYWYDLLD